MEERDKRLPRGVSSLFEADRHAQEHIRSCYQLIGSLEASGPVRSGSVQPGVTDHLCVPELVESRQ